MDYSCQTATGQGQLVMKALEAFARPIHEGRKEDWKIKQKARLQEVAREISRRHRETEKTEAETTGAENSSAEIERTKDGYAEIPHAEPGHAKANSTGVRHDAGGCTEEQSHNIVGCIPVESAEGKISAETQITAQAPEKISAETFSQFMNQVRADAFSAMAEHFLATSGEYPQFQGLKGAERCQVVLHVDINTLRQQQSGVCCTHSKNHFEDKPWLSPQTARRLSCDASLVTVLEDDAGKVLNVGRRSRIVPAHIRRALMERDGVCRYPGCHESRYVDAHHIKHWAEGGETSLDNLAVLCRYHHAQLHRGCFDVRRDNKSGHLVFHPLGQK